MVRPKSITITSMIKKGWLQLHTKTHLAAAVAAVVLPAAAAAAAAHLALQHKVQQHCAAGAGAELNSGHKWRWKHTDGAWY